MIDLESFSLLAIARWLLTYSVHSSLLLGSAWILSRKLPRLGDGLWKTALLGGLLTSSLQIATGFGSVSGTVHLRAAAPGPATTTTSAPQSATVDYERPGESEGRTRLFARNRTLRQLDCDRAQLRCELLGRVCPPALCHAALRIRDRARQYARLATPRATGIPCSSTN